MTATKFLPASADEMKALGWEQADIIIVSGDAYVDHPSFGTAVMARIAEYCGMKVAVLPQPNWRDDLRDFRKLGQPRLFFGVTAGCMDSMVNHYTARKRLRSNDAYTPGGRAGFRPDYATIVYSKILKSIYPDVPVILGGIEASLRRLTHYDYWSGQLKPSVLIDSGADMILFGMAEKAMIELISELNKGRNLNELKDIQQTAILTEHLPAESSHHIILPSHEECLKKKSSFANMFVLTEKESNSVHSKPLYQQTGRKIIKINASFSPLTTEETDLSFDLPYSRLPHPRYRNKPPIPAFEMIRHSVTIHRGCFGGCSFCAISAHQGKFIASRSETSVMKELHEIAAQPDFKGHISDLGGPSANMFQMHGIQLSLCEKCHRPSCIYPEICKNLNFNHAPLLRLYASALQISNIRKVTIGSGIRYDMLVGFNKQTDEQYCLTEYAQTLIAKHVSGRLKIAPEHISEQVLKLMRKPSFEKFRSFHKLFHNANATNQLMQELVLYLIAGHPGSTDKDMLELQQTTRKMGYTVETVQEFTPTPMTLSSVMYYTGIDPFTGKVVYVPEVNKQISQQKNMMFRKKK